MVGGSEVRTASAFVHDVQEKHPLFAVVLVLFQIFALLRRGATDFEEFDLVYLERVGNFSHEVLELDKDEDTLFLGNRVSAVSNRELG